MTRGWEHLPGTSHVGVRGWGSSRADAFASAAEGMFALMLAPADVATPETREARAQGATPEAMLVSWLNECLYVHEIEGFAVARVEVDTCRDGLVHGVLHGEPLDPDRHRVACVVKGAAAHHVEVREREDVTEVRVVVEM